MRIIMNGSLRNRLRTGKQGSRVIVITRSQGVAWIMRTLPAHHVGQLSFEDCWSAFIRSEVSILQNQKIYYTVVIYGICQVRRVIFYPLLEISLSLWCKDITCLTIISRFWEFFEGESAHTSLKASIINEREKLKSLHDFSSRITHERLFMFDGLPGRRLTNQSCIISDWEFWASQIFPRRWFANEPKITPNCELREPHLLHWNGVGQAHISKKLQHSWMSRCGIISRRLAVANGFNFSVYPRNSWSQNLTEGVLHLMVLEKLEIRECNELLSLQDQGLPESLSFLEMWKCPMFTGRCLKKKGEDWIARIPCKNLDYKVVLWPA